MLALETGTVKWFSVEKGYGFIERDEGGDLFAHRTALADPEVRKLEPGQRVQFHAERSPKGPKAADITVLDPGAAAVRPARSASVVKASSGAENSSENDSSGAEDEPELRTLDEQLERTLGERLLHRR